MTHSRVIGTFPCPVCKIELPIPAGGVAKFDDNQHVKVEQSLQKVAIHVERLLCEVRLSMCIGTVASHESYFAKILR